MRKQLISSTEIEVNLDNLIY